MRHSLWNDNWLYWPEGNAFALVWNVSPEARTVTLPHDAMLERPARADSPNGTSGGFRDGENYVYVKTLRLAEGDRRRHVLRFEGAYCHALVYVNESYAGGCPYGYSRFDVDLTDWLKPGDNEVRVLLRNAGMTNSRWYSGGGLYRDVWLLTAGPVYLDPDGLRVRTETADPQQATLLTEAGVANRSDTPRELLLLREVLDGAGRICASDKTRLFLKGGETRQSRRRLVLPEPKLWGETHPDLYTLRCRVLEGETELDSEETRFGVRTLTLDAARGLRVNGEEVKLRGSCIHHDNGLLGAAAHPAAERRRVRLLKAAGFNAIRMSHHPASPALLDACDAEGMFVMDELTDMWNRPKSRLDYAMDFEANWRADAARMVAKDYNHPCVVLYSVGNEIPEIGNPAGSRLGAEINAYLHELDPARFTTAGINGIFVLGGRMERIVADLLGQTPPESSGDANVNEVMASIMGRMDDILRHEELSETLELATDGLDAAGYNYMTPRYEMDAKRYPQRVLVGSETYPPQIAENWALVEKLPNLIGDFTWTGWDYIGEAGIGVPSYGSAFTGSLGGDWPIQLAYCGDIDITGFRRPASYFREIVFGRRTAPYLAVRDPAHYGEAMTDNPWVFSDAVAKWDWPGYEGRSAVVEVYAPGDEAELFFNGVSLGRKPLTGFRTSFETEYRPGTLEVASYEKGAELGRFRLETPGEAAGLRIEKEWEDGGLLWLSVAPVDAQGRVCAGRDLELTAAVAGGELLGFGSGDHSPLYNYNENRAKTWNGRAQLILRRGEGPLSVHVESALGAADWAD